MAEEEQVTEEQEPSRERFDEELVRRSFEFGQDILKDIPELEVLTIVPVWGLPQDKMVPAIYLTGMSPHQLLLTFDRFLAGMEYKLNRMKELLQATGEMLNKQAGEIDANQKTIEGQKAEIGTKATSEEE